MERIKKNLENLSENSTALLRQLLDVKSKTSSSLLAKLCSLQGIDLLLSHLTENELQIFSCACNNPGGVTYSELEKHTHLKIDKIDEIAGALKEKLLIYVLMNRKHLSKNLDKIYVYKPILEILHPKDQSAIFTILKNNIAATTKDKDAARSPKERIKIQDPHKILATIFGHGGIITLRKLYELFPGKKIDALLNGYQEKHFLTICHYLDFPPNTFIILNTQAFSFFMAQEPNEKKSINIHNHYFLVNNLLEVYDTISTYGLYLTQQKEFRKIDWKRITDALYPLYDIDGRYVSKDETAKLCLYIFHILNTIKEKKDAIFIRFRELHDIIHSPLKFLKKIYCSLNEEQEIPPAFTPPFSIPSQKNIALIIENIKHVQHIEENVLQTMFFIKNIISSNSSLKRLSEFRTHLHEKFTNTLRFMVLTGVIQKINTSYQLSDIGQAIYLAVKAQSNDIATPPPPEKKFLYINPDFTLMVPKEEISSYTIYLILAYTEIIKNDIMLHAKISKESILKAYKRGMNIEHFITLLENIAKNEIPQNLEFLLHDWINQNLSLQVSYVTLLKVNHPSFLDEISYSPLKESIIERLSKNYAIINRDKLEDIIKLAEKQKAIISIFDEYDQE